MQTENRNEEIEIRSFQHFHEVAVHKTRHNINVGMGFWDRPLFRGVGNLDWGLETTLERSDLFEKSLTLRQYFQEAYALRSAVESLTGRRWHELPSPPQMEKLMEEHQSLWLDQTMNYSGGTFEYFTYLRHHGFPSPMLDWTLSPYVAAFFAFDGMDSRASHVAVHALVMEKPRAISKDAHLFTVGPHITTHPRHFLQQSRYSMCVGAEEESDYGFVPHADAIIPARGLYVQRFTIPTHIRLSFLCELDLMNINAHSLYGGEDSLIKTLMFRHSFSR